MSRLLASVHHIVSKSDPAKLGYTRLNVILWHSDLEHYRWHGWTITGLNQYERTPHGPASKHISRAIQVLIKQGSIAEREVAVDGIVRRETICLREPSIPALNVEQISILNHTVKVISALNASQLFQMIDQDRLWQEVSNNKAMLVSTGSVINQRLSSTRVDRVRF